MAKRSNTLPVTNLDALAYLSAFLPDESRREFWRESAGAWRKMLSGKNPVYETIALMHAHQYLEGKELFSVYRAKLDSPDPFVGILGVWGLDRLGTDEAKRVLQGCSRGSFSDKTEVWQMATNVLKTFDKPLEEKGDYLSDLLWQGCAESYLMDFAGYRDNMVHQPALWLKNAAADPIPGFLKHEGAKVSSSVTSGDTLPESMLDAWGEGDEPMWWYPRAKRESVIWKSWDEYDQLIKWLTVVTFPMDYSGPYTPEIAESWAAFVQRRNDSLPPMLYDEFLCLRLSRVADEARSTERFWTSMNAVWRSFLTAKNPCYRLLGITRADFFLHGKDLVAACENALREKNIVFHFYAIEHLKDALTRGETDKATVARILHAYLDSPTATEDNTYDVRASAKEVFEMAK